MPDGLGARRSLTLDPTPLLQASLAEASGPRYEALGKALHEAISSGAIGAGAKLPAERDLARRLGLSRVTVSRSYDLLRQSGWARSRVGSGTFAVRPEPAGRREWMRDVVDGGTPYRSLAAEVVNLTTSRPRPFADELRAATERSAPRVAGLAEHLEYATQGLPALREAIAARFTARGLPTDAQQILVTTGAQQAINLIARLHVDPGAPALVESPTYLGAIDALLMRRAELVTFDPIDDPDRLAHVIESHRPRLLFAMTTCHTVTGRVTPAAHREALAALAETHQLPIVDDDIFAGLTFEDEPQRPLASYAEDAPIYTIGSLSKLAWNGLRIGWIRSPPALLTRLARLKGTDDLGTSLIAQVVAHELLTDADALAASRRAEAQRAITDAIGLLRAALPSWRIDRPEGGRSLWIQLPGPDADSGSFVQTALLHGVLIAAGATFSPDQRHRDRLRLMPVQPEGILAEGVRRLSIAWDALRRGPVAEPPPAVGQRRRGPL